SVRSVVAAWRAPERVAASSGWDDPAIGLVDVPVFGETAVLAARRGGDGRPAPLALGPVMAPRGAAGALHVAEIAHSARETIAVRGPAVPKFPPPPEMDTAATPSFAVGANGFADTGYPCTVDPATRTLAITGPPAGIVGVGGYRFADSTLAEIATGAEPGSRIAAEPDALTGRRLAGDAREVERVREELMQHGLNPLIVAAFAADRAA